MRKMQELLQPKQAAEGQDFFSFAHMENFILIEYFSNQTFQLFLLVKMMQMRYLYVCVVKIISKDVSG